MRVLYTLLVVAISFVASDAAATVKNSNPAVAELITPVRATRALEAEKTGNKRLLRSDDDKNSEERGIFDSISNGWDNLTENIRVSKLRKKFWELYYAGETPETMKAKVAEATTDKEKKKAEKLANEYTTWYDAQKAGTTSDGLF